MGDENLFRLPEAKKSRRHSVIGLLPDSIINRKRKRKLDDDSISLQSFDSGTSRQHLSTSPVRHTRRRVSTTSNDEIDSTSVSQKKSRRKSLLRVSSLANLLSPKAVRKTETLKRSLSFKSSQPPPSARTTLSPYKAPSPSCARRRLSRTWSDMMPENSNLLSQLSHQDIKHQEAIYELYQGELDLIEDLNNVKNTYRDSMQKLGLMTEGELEQIFGRVDELIPLHEDLVERMLSQRQTDGTTQEVGKQLVDWVPTLKAYIAFCANQVFGKVLLDEKKNDPAVDDFLQRCQDSPFSRKLDLWGLIDGVRGRFMKYPLLLKSIQKYCRDHEEEKHLAEAVRLAEGVVAEADQKTGEAKCIYYRSRITYLYEDQRHPDIEDSTSLLGNGILKNNKGSKLQLFLFDRVLVVTRLVCQSGQQFYQVYRDPIPMEDLVCENLKDGEVRMGSFRSAFSSSQTSKNIFRVSFRDSNKGQSHTLMCTDEHDKRQWLQWINKAIQTYKDKSRSKDDG